MENNPSLTKEDLEQYRPLFKLGAYVAIATVILIPLTTIAIFIWPIYPEDIFEIIQASKLAGVMSLDFMYFSVNIISAPLFLALYISLRRANPSYSLIAVVVGLIGLTLIFVARPISEMFTISDQIAAAATETEKSQWLAAGKTLYTLFRGTAYNMHYILGTVSLVITSFIMLQSDLYSKATAYVGIIANLFTFLLYVPSVGIYLSILSVFGLAAWDIMIARRLLQLARQ